MLHEQTHEKLIAMKFFGMVNALKDRLERRDHQDLSKTEFLGLLVDDLERCPELVRSCLPKIVHLEWRM